MCAQDSNLETRHPQEGRQPLASIEKEIDLHIAEYNAMTMRATYMITIMAGIWPLILIYLGFVWQFWRPPNTPIADALSGLFKSDRDRLVMIWGNAFIVQLMVRVLVGFLGEQYSLVLYIEKHLRAAVDKLVFSHHYWGYERFLMLRRRGPTSTWWEAAMPSGVLIVLIALVVLCWPLHRWDYVALSINFLLCISTFGQAIAAARSRIEWEKCLRSYDSGGEITRGAITADRRKVEAPEISKNEEGA